ncbi:MAG: mercury methylation corrinoid protein HgcA [Firmicutes bacterium]|nr:mercury methylation corrinoid protein HgcA [Bacillota bacterium]
MSEEKFCCGFAGCCAAPKIPVVSTSLTAQDILGAWKVRFGIGRMDYTVEPGLYSIGQPDNASPVLVSANYKLTFDTLRKNLCALDCWLLILDTKGVNVWCAAGKGTFGTEELLYRIEKSELAEIVTHRRLILPQLGASGVNSNEILRRCGFSVIFGPVRADDIQKFIACGYTADQEMRIVKFTMRDRLVLTPLELVTAAKISLMVFGVLFLINLFAARPFGMRDFLAYTAAVLIGTVITPVLLPFIPGKAFAFKGWLVGILGTALIIWAYGWFSTPFLLLGLGYMLALPVHSAFLAMNFTGSSTYTSPSGVLKEMKIALPLIILSLLSGLVLILIKTLGG